MSISLPEPRVIRHESEYGRWELVLAAPTAPLRAYVGEYQGYAEQTPHTIQRREVPSGILPLIINFGPSFRILDPEDPDRGEARDSFVAGLHETYALVESTGTAYCMQVNLTPVGARRLLGLPMCDLTNRVVELDDLLGTEAHYLIDRLVEAPDWETRFTLLDAFFSERLTATPDLPQSTLWAWDRLADTAGQTSIGALADTLGWSRKHLVAQFHEHIGLPPKRIARILRFQRAIHLLTDQTATRWVDIALRCGYYDQAHLIKDFRQFAGCTPGEFDRRLLADDGGVMETGLDGSR